MVGLGQGEEGVSLPRVSAGLRSGGVETEGCAGMMKRKENRLWKGREELMRGQFGQCDSLKGLTVQGVDQEVLGAQGTGPWSFKCAGVMKLGGTQVTQGNQE